MSTGDSDYVRYVKEDCLDVDPMNAYSSYWISTKRESRTKREPGLDKNNKIKVMPSKAFNDLHSLLENVERSNDANSDEEMSGHVPLSSTKSDYVLNPYKLSNKGDNVPLTRMSDKIIESMCKYDTKPQFDHSQLVDEPFKNDTDGAKENSEQHLKQFLITSGQNESIKAMSNYSDSVAESQGDERYQSNKHQTYNDKKENQDNNIRQTDLESSKSREALLKENNQNILSDNGKLVAEINVTSINLTDQDGRDFPVMIKYVWETDISDILNSTKGINETSKAFIKTIKTLSSLSTQMNNQNFNGKSESDQFLKSSNRKRARERLNIGGYTTNKTQNISLYEKEQQKSNRELSTGKNNTLNRGANSKIRINRSRFSFRNSTINRKQLTSFNEDDDNAEIKTTADNAFSSYSKQSSISTFREMRGSNHIGSRTNSEITKRSNELRPPSSAQGTPNAFKNDFSLRQKLHKPPSAPSRVSHLKSIGRSDINAVDTVTTFAKKSFGYNKLKQSWK